MCCSHRFLVRSRTTVPVVLTRILQLFGPSGNAPLPKQHTLETLKPEIARAVEDLEQENAASEAEAERMLNEIRTRISDLSDLKYGHFSKGNSDGQGLAEEVVENLRQLEELCKEGNG